MFEILRETPNEEKESAYYNYTRELIDRLSTLLYHEYSGKEMADSSKKEDPSV